MAITYNTGATDDNDLSSGDNDLSISSTGVDEDDFVLWTTYCDTAVIDPLIPSGFTDIGVFDVTTSGTGRSMWTRVGYKIATGSEPANYTTSMGGADSNCSAAMNAWAGVDTTTPLDITLTSSHEANGEDNSLPNAPDIDTSAGNDGDMIVTIHFASHDDVTVAGAPSGFTERTGIPGASKDHRQQFVSDKIQTTKGNEVIGVWTHTASPTTTAEWHVATLALREAGGGGPSLPAGSLALLGAGI